MTRRQLAILFAAALSILYCYQIISAVLSDSSVDALHGLGLILALGLLITQIKSDKNPSDG